MYKKLQEYYKRLSKESWLRSLLYGLSVGFSVMSIVAVTLWLTVEENYFWVAIIVGVAIAALITLACYHWLFKPSEKKLVRRVDDLGLEERLLTMRELKDDDSYIAKKQREDALASLSRVSAQLLTIAVSTSLIVTTAIIATFGIGVTVVTALPIADSLKESIEDGFAPDPIEYEVTYEAGEGGMIEGDMFQLILHGGDGTGVMAEAEEEYIFVEWSDGVKTPYRVDKNVKGSFTVTAIFQYSENSDEEDGEGEGEEPSDKPGEEEGEPQPSDKPGDPTDEPPSDEQQAGGRYEPQNQIRDGETYYGDEYEDAFNEAMEEVAQDGDLNGGQKDIIGDYFDAIQN